MPNIPSPFDYELPNQLQYAHQILENSKGLVSTAAASTPTITSIDAKSASDFLQFLGASLFNSIQLKNLHKSLSSDTVVNSTTGDSAILATTPRMDVDMYAPNHVVIDSSFGAMDEMQKQLEYDKFMNEVWIGIVLTLVLISMIFCICSCFLYHQFRTWKRNYHSTVAHSQMSDIEAIKLQADIDDPVPEYTLVSGLPSYEAALELMQKTPQSCLLVYPSVFNIFTKNEKMPMAADTTAVVTQQPAPQQQQQQQQVIEATMPLLSATTNTTTTTTATARNTSTTVGAQTGKTVMALPTCHNSKTCDKDKSKHNTTTATTEPAPTTTTTPPATTITASFTATATLPSNTFAKLTPSNAAKHPEKH